MAMDVVRVTDERVFRYFFSRRVCAGRGLWVLDIDEAQPFEFGGPLENMCRAQASNEDFKCALAGAGLRLIAVEPHPILESILEPSLAS
jgi:hypothetical protein